MSETCPRKKVYVACLSDFNEQNFKDFQCQVKLYVATTLVNLTSDLDWVLFVLSFIKERNIAT